MYYYIILEKGPCERTLLQILNSLKILLVKTRKI